MIAHTQPVRMLDESKFPPAVIYTEPTKLASLTPETEGCRSLFKAQN